MFWSGWYLVPPTVTYFLVFLSCDHKILHFQIRLITSFSNLVTPNNKGLGKQADMLSLNETTAQKQWKTTTLLEKKTTNVRQKKQQVFVHVTFPKTGWAET